MERPCLPYLFLLFMFYHFSLFWDRVCHVTYLSSDSLHELLILLPPPSECWHHSDTWACLINSGFVLCMTDKYSRNCVTSPATTPSPVSFLLAVLFGMVGTLVEAVTFRSQTRILDLAVALLP